MKENQTLSVIELLRPENWLDTEYVQVRHVTEDRILTEAELAQMESAEEFEGNPEDYALEIWIELPEMGVLGWAALVAIDEEVTMKDGSGNVVTGTFAHVSDNVMDLQLEGQAKPIGCTSNHPFWSVDRQDFVEAGQLMEGEQVRLYNGETKRVIQKLPRPGPEIVYNLEVYAEHVYHVTQDGVLVHNSCEDRVQEIHGAVKQATQNRTTIAILNTKEGMSIVASSETNLRIAQRKMLDLSKETEAVLTGHYHAGVRAILYAVQKGYTPTNIVASRRICKACADFLKQYGVEILSPLK